MPCRASRGGRLAQHRARSACTAAGQDRPARLLDLCCINCIHILPDLAKLEKKYPNELVVIGVHSAKFDNEKDTENIPQGPATRSSTRSSTTPTRSIWNRYGVESWPTLVLIDPEGNFLGGTIAARGITTVLDQVIGKLVEQVQGRQLNETPLKFFRREREARHTPAVLPRQGAGRRPRASGCSSPTAPTTASSITDLDGKIAVAGTGAEGWPTATFDKAEFNDPQGMAWTATRSTSPTARTTPSAPST